jgi:hypothetical protein
MVLMNSLSGDWSLRMTMRAEDVDNARAGLDAAKMFAEKSDVFSAELETVRGLQVQTV